MRTLHAISVIAAMALTPACYMDWDTGWEDDGSWETGPTTPPPGGGSWGWDPTGTEGPVDVRDATLAGPIGDVRLGGEIYEASGSRYAGTLSVTMYGRGTGGEAMGQVSLNATDGELRLPVGSRFDNAYDSAVYVSALGCSGDSRGSWTYDQSPSEATVEVAEGPSPNERRMDVRLVFSGGEVVTGSYTVAVDPATDLLDVPDTLVVGDAQLGGSLGTVSASLGDARVTGAFEDAGVSTVGIAADDASGTLALELSVEGTLHHYDLSYAGASYSYTPADRYPGSGLLWIGARGRSAPASGVETSRGADLVTLTVLEPGRVHVEATFGSQTIETIFSSHLE